MHIGDAPAIYYRATNARRNGAASATAHNYQLGHATAMMRYQPQQRYLHFYRIAEIMHRPIGAIFCNVDIESRQYNAAHALTSRLA